MNATDKYKVKMPAYKYNKYERYVRISEADEYGVLYRKQGKRLMMCPNSELTEYTIKEGAEVILDDAFSGCKALRKISVPASVTTIGKSAFLGCESLQEINIPESVTKIGESAFDGCESLQEITLREGVTKIGLLAFCGCLPLTEVRLPASVEKIGYCAFKDCGNIAKFEVTEGNPNFCAVDGILYSKDMTTLIQYPAAKPDTSFRIPEGVTHICGYAFSGCKALMEVTIGPNVTYLGDRAFYDCPSLVHANYCATACEKAECIFENCSKLTNVIIGENVTRLPDGLFSSCEAMEEITLPESVTHIGPYAFSGCTKLEHITIPAGVTELSDGTFSRCESMEGVTLPDTLKVIGDHAFSGCSGLKEFRVPENVMEIGPAAFYCCTGLTKITLPDALEAIGNYAFCECENLEKIRLPRGVTSIGRGAFNRFRPDFSAKLEIDVRDSSYCMVDDVLYTKDMTTLVADFNPSREGPIIVPPNVKKIADDAFLCCGISAITLPEGLTHIGRNAFCQCSSLTSVTLPSTIEDIWSGAFAYCPDLTTITSLNPTPPDCGEMFSSPDWDDFHTEPPATCVLRVPKGAKEAYATHAEWREFKHIKEIEDDNK